MFRLTLFAVSIVAASGCASDSGPAAGEPSDHDRANVAVAHDVDKDRMPAVQDQRWPGEAGVLADHVQLTFPDRFVKAGESYFSPDDSKIVFQAVEVPGAKDAPYQMYAADVVRDEDGDITGIDNIIRLSPLDSANTCGWFHPTKPNTVIFGSTIVKPAAPEAAGYQRGTGRYKWLFPKEMTIVQCDLAKADGTADTLEILFDDPKAYLAECSFTRDGRHLLFCRYRESDGPAGGDLIVKDLESGRLTTLVDAPGYDGGPFFSPDEKWICYRSDRRGNHELQLFIAELEYDDAGTIVGLKREVPITDNEHVNWAPFWDISGRYLVYATSEEGHRNYEVYAIDTLPGRRSGTAAAAELTKRRVTNAAGFDGLPVFNSDGTLMMWTSQRDETGSSQLWVARFLMEFGN